MTPKRPVDILLSPKRVRVNTTKSVSWLSNDFSHFLARFFLYKRYTYIINASAKLLNIYIYI